MSKSKNKWECDECILNKNPGLRIEKPLHNQSKEGTLVICFFKLHNIIYQSIIFPMFLTGIIPFCS